MTLAQIRDARLRVAIQQQIRHYLGGDHKRACAWCGRMFKAVQRYHFLCSDDCRRHWKAGVFRPSNKENVRKERAA